MSKTKKSRAIRKKNRVKAAKVAAGTHKSKGGSNNDAGSNNDGGGGQGAAAAAAEYLQQWAEQQRQPDEEGIWKFAKKRQIFLLKSWPDRQHVSADTFKLLLLYARSLPEAGAERTVTQAREVAANAERALEALAQIPKATGADEPLQDDDDDDDDDDEQAQALREAGAALTEEQREEQRALLMIQRQRALRLIQVLTPTEG